ncbi:LOW QUALITY PROTEIN: uncharacterized protein [Amphiura filiformis]|uniref:LOW QUALITY PROTEIN: uncharacterized protein n=1 Tax=Amphiura filiformis TaxID=82378 RepID=UPI003B220134
MAADVKWCASCEGAGVKSRLRIMQINMEEAAVLCESPQCTNTSTKIIPRSVSRLNVIKRKKQRASVSSPPSVPPESPMSPAPYEPNHIPNGIPGSTNTGTVPSLPQLRTQLWEDHVIQWQNTDALCWLDVSMCVLVHCTSLRLCLRRLGEASLLHELCNEFDKAQCASERGDFVIEGSKQRTNHDRLQQNGSHQSHDQSHDQCNPSHSHSMQTSPQISLNNLEAEAALEWLVMSDEEGAKHRDLFLADKAKQGQIDPQVIKDEPKPTAEGVLESIREKLWKALEVKLDCKLGKEETPVFALPLLCRLSGAVEEHFMTRYRWEFFCSVCNHSEITVCTKAMTCFTQLASDFTLLSPAILKMCPACRSPDQRCQLVYHSLPSCMMFQFSQGAPTSDVNAYNFKTETSGVYEVSSIVQYIGNPNHFIAWIRDTHRNMWLKCNDLETPVCKWQNQAPSIPASEIHIVVLERQGDPCDRCDAMNSEMGRIKGNIDHLVEKLALLNGGVKRSSAPPPAPVPKISNGADTCSQTVPNGRLSHLWHRRASSFQSYSSSGKTTTTPSHVSIIDVDGEDNENSCHSAPGSIDGNVGKERKWEGMDEGGSSRSSSPGLESYSRSRKRALPNYLDTSGYGPRSRGKTNAQTCRTKEGNNKEDVASYKKHTGVVKSSAADIRYGNSNVYTRRVRPTGKIATKRSYYQHKTYFPSYSDSQALKTKNNEPALEPTLIASLPEGAFVCVTLCGAARVPNHRTESTSSPNKLHLDAKSLLAVSQMARPRCNSLSSVSSPSACSDLSSISDSMSSSSNGGKDDLGSTIDELYKALEIGCTTSDLESRIPSPTLDDDFLAQILADDPVYADTNSAANSGIIIKGSVSEPSLDRTRPTGQELDRIVPSIEPMAQDLLAKLVT